ncbi:MAG: hypothetical protein KJO23_02650 [Bacteroidia bacterium]|nr:hypothetical protein [Bacteroidia bacterium]NNM24278.1 hypothetical protein [Flavobacteriaceae bacterium]
MNKKGKVYSGMIESFQQKEIYLNVNHLNDGQYVLKIVHHNRVLKHTTFKK